MTRAFHYVSRSKRRLTLSGAILVVLATTIGAVAYFSNTGSGNGTPVASGTLGSPAPVSASTHAHITWTTVPAPTGSNSDVSYTVDRNNGSGFVSAAGSCAGSLLQTMVSCDDVQTLPSGSYTYRVTAHWHSWTSSATSSSVNIDVIAPTSTIAFPTATVYNNASWDGTVTPCGGDCIYGAAQDDSGGSGVHDVKVSILGPQGKWWNGSSFSSVSETKILAPGGTAWSLSFASANFATIGGGDGSYTVTSYATDNNSNTQSPGATVTFTIDNTKPSVTVNQAAGQADPTNLSPINFTAVFSEPINTGSFTSGDVSVTGTAAATGVVITQIAPNDGTTFNLAVSGPASDGTVIASIPAGGVNDLAGNSNNASTSIDHTVTYDTHAPTVTATVIGQAAGAVVNGFVQKNSGYFIYANATDATSTVQSVTANVNNVTAGATAVALSSSGGPFAAPGGGSYTYRSASRTSNPSQADGTVTYTVNATDTAGNTSSYSNNGSVTFDTTVPAVAVGTITKTGTAACEFINGSAAVYFSTTNTNGNSCGSASGTFTVPVTATDTGGSLMQKVNYPTGGLTNVTGGGDVPGAGPAFTTTYSWGSTSTGSASTITGYDNINNQGTAPFTITLDNTAPTTVNPPTANAGPSNGYYISLSVPVTLGSASDNTGGSGVNTIQLQRASAALSSGTCGSFASPTWNNVTLSGGNDTGVASGNCYEYRDLATDQVGNQAASTATSAIKVDTTVPTITTTSPLTGSSSPSSCQFIFGTSVWYSTTNTNNSCGSASGSFTVAATASDTDSGIQDVLFPTLGSGGSGLSGGGDVLSPGPYSVTYSWTATSTTSGTKTITATNNALLTNTSSFIETLDNTAPTGGSVAATGLGGTGSLYSTTTTLSIGFTTGSDNAGGSGLNTAGAMLLRASASLTSSNGVANGTCGTYSAFAQVGSNNPSTPFTDNAADGITTGNCYEYEYLVPDNVGNVATYTSGDIKVDTTGPTLSYTSTGTNVFATGSGPVFFKGSGSGTFTVTVIDAQSGVTSTPTFPTITGWTGGAVSGTSRTYSYTSGSSSSSSSITGSTNGAGTTTSPLTITITVDTAAPTNSITLVNQGTFNGNATSFLSGTKIYYNGNATSGQTFQIQNGVADGGSGPASSLFNALGGTATGFTFTGSTVTTPPNGPYQSNAVTWTSGTSSAPTENITGADNVGNTTATGNFTLTNDITGPTGGALQVNNTAATSVGSTSSATSTSFAINTDTPYSADAGSGFKSSLTTVQSETFTNNTCGAPGSGGPFLTATTVSGTTQPGTIQAGYCYLYTITGTDNVGNTSVLKTTVSLAGTESQVVFTTDPSGGSTSTPWSTQPVVAVEDASGNTVAGASDSIMLAITTNPGGGTLTCTTNPLTAVAGVATFAGCQIDKAGTGYVLTASAAGLSSDTTPPFDVTQTNVPLFQAIGNATTYITSGSVTVNYPTGAASGDLLILVACINTEDGNPFPNGFTSGTVTWTRDADSGNIAGTPSLHCNGYHATDGGETSATFTLASGHVPASGGEAWVIDYHKPSGTFTFVSATKSSGTVAPVKPSVATVGPTVPAIEIEYVVNTTATSLSLNAGSGFVSEGTNSVTPAGGSPAIPVTLGVADSVQTTASATPAQATWTGQNTSWFGVADVAR